MRIITENDVHAVLRYPDFIEALDHAFSGSFTMPPRQVLLLEPGSDKNDAFAMLPSWNDEIIALKAFTYFPENQAPYRSLYSKILIFDRHHGEPLALVDGGSVTYLRTAGVSALASKHLSRKDSKTMLLLGTGNLACYLIRSHASVRPLEKVMVWGRSPEKAHLIVEKMRKELQGIEFEVVTDLESSCRMSDLVISATASTDILVRGEWIREGAHTDFMGNHHAHHRECDTEMVTRSRVFVDTRLNCFREAGEILMPVEEGVFSLDRVAGELAELCRGDVPGRQNAEEITMFKSVGCALGDLCGALTVWKAGV